MHILLNRGAMFDIATRSDTSTWLSLLQKNRLYSSMTLQKAQEHREFYSLQVETQIEP